MSNDKKKGSFSLFFSSSSDDDTSDDTSNQLIMSSFLSLKGRAYWPSRAALLGLLYERRVGSRLQPYRSLLVSLLLLSVGRWSYVVEGCVYLRILYILRETMGSDRWAGKFILE